MSEAKEIPSVLKKEIVGDKVKYTYQPLVPVAGGSKAKAKTKVRINYPKACNKVRLLNLAEIDAPAGFTLTLDLPFPIPESSLKKFADSLQLSGGTMEIEE